MPRQCEEAAQVSGTNIGQLRGGQGSAWRVADVVLKPRTDPTLQAWLGAELAGVDQVGFTLTDVLRAIDGRRVVDGWGATTLRPAVMTIRARTYTCGRLLE